MTINGWAAFIITSLCIFCFGACGCFFCEQVWAKVASVVVAVLVCGGLLAGMLWYYNNTASGQRALTDQKSNFANGMERTITVYTADGKIIAQYTGRIDIEGNDGGYVLFDYEGKRYTYYNCFVESVAEID